jgi:hypothetical protein
MLRQAQLDKAGEASAIAARLIIKDPLMAF